MKVEKVIRNSLMNETLNKLDISGTGTSLVELVPIRFPVNSTPPKSCPRRGSLDKPDMKAAFQIH